MRLNTDFENTIPLKIVNATRVKKKRPKDGKDYFVDYNDDAGYGLCNYGEGLRLRLRRYRIFGNL
jgi:hypothetical protein